MTLINPYESPSSDILASSRNSDRPALPSPSRLESIILGFLIFAIVSCTVFVGLTVTFFSGPAVSGASFLSGVIAIAVGIAATHFVTRTGVVRWVEPASLVAFIATALFTLIVLLTDNRDLERVLVPSSLSRIAPGHLVLISLSIVAAMFGIWGCVRAYWSHRTVAALVAGGCGAAAGFHCIAVGMRLFIDS